MTFRFCAGALEECFHSFWLGDVGEPVHRISREGIGGPFCPECRGFEVIGGLERRLEGQRAIPLASTKAVFELLKLQPMD